MRLQMYAVPAPALPVSRITLAVSLAAQLIAQIYERDTCAKATTAPPHATQKPAEIHVKPAVSSEMSRAAEGAAKTAFPSNPFALTAKRMKTGQQVKPKARRTAVREKVEMEQEQQEAETA